MPKVYLPVLLGSLFLIVLAGMIAMGPGTHVAAQSASGAAMRSLVTRSLAGVHVGPKRVIRLRYGVVRAHRPSATQTITSGRL